MSSLVRAAKVVLANGTVVTIDGGRPEHLAAIRCVNRVFLACPSSSLTELNFKQVQRGTAGRGGGADAGRREERHGLPQLHAARPVGACVCASLTITESNQGLTNSYLRPQQAVLADMDRALADPTAVDGLQFCYFPVLRTVMRSEVRVRTYVRSPADRHTPLKPLTQNHPTPPM